MLGSGHKAVFATLTEFISQHYASWARGVMAGDAPAFYEAYIFTNKKNLIVRTSYNNKKRNWQMLTITYRVLIYYFHVLYEIISHVRMERHNGVPGPPPAYENPISNDVTSHVWSRRRKTKKWELKKTFFEFCKMGETF